VGTGAAPFCMVHPDLEPSDAPTVIMARGRDLIFLLTVTDLGAICVRTTSDLADLSGKLIPVGISLRSRSKASQL
jgi:hypothetical protein